MIQFWDTGFRTFFSQSLDLKSSLKHNGTLTSVKGIIVEMMKSHFHHLTNDQISEDGGFMMIIAKKI